MAEPILLTPRRDLTHLRTLLENERRWRAEDVAILSTMQGKIKGLLHTLMEFVIATRDKKEIGQIKKIRGAVVDLLNKIFKEIEVASSRDENPRIKIATIPTFVQLRRAVDNELNVILAAADYLIQSGKPASVIELTQRIKGEITALRTLEREEDVVSNKIIGMDLTQFGAPIMLRPTRDQKSVTLTPKRPPVSKLRKFFGI